MTEAIHIDELSFCYGKAPVLKEVNLSVKEGEFIGIIGPNGGGKTTLLRLLMGFLKPHKGTLSVLGASPREARSHIGYVPQSHAFDPDFPMTVLDLVLGGRLGKASWPGRYGKTHRRAALSALERVGLAGLESKRFQSLSGGQAQRALIARALASEPRLLLLDEAFSGADPKVKEDLQGLLETVRRSCTILMVTHDLHVAIQQVDRVVCVQTRVSTFQTEEICEHFALGLYHAPLAGSNHMRQ